jgi:hypothetical protein
MTILLRSTLHAVQLHTFFLWIWFTVYLWCLGQWVSLGYASGEAENFVIYAWLKKLKAMSVACVDLCRYTWLGGQKRCLYESGREMKRQASYRQV